jgi:hypothetical protein
MSIIVYVLVCLPDRISLLSCPTFLGDLLVYIGARSCTSSNLRASCGTWSIWRHLLGCCGGLNLGVRDQIGQLGSIVRYMICEALVHYRERNENGSGSNTHTFPFPQ